MSRFSPLHPLRHLIATLVLCCATTLPAGPDAKVLHYSLTEATPNFDRSRLLVTVRVQTTDFETVLSERAKKKVSVSDLSELAPLALGYVREKLSLSNAHGEELRLEWAGQDVTDSQLFLFFEAPLKGGLRGAHIRNSLFVESLPDQINSVEVHDGLLKKTLVFSRDNISQVVDDKL